MKKILKTKRHFQLLEVIIALFLIASCALPIMGTYSYIYREQMLAKHDMDMDHAALLLHAQIVTTLYQEGSEGKSLKEKIGVETPVNLGQLDLENSPYQVSYKLEVLEPKKEKTQAKTKNLLLALKIEAKKIKASEKEKPRQYSYNVCVHREFVEGKNDFESGKAKNEKK